MFSNMCWISTARSPALSIYAMRVEHGQPPSPNKSPFRVRTRRGRSISLQGSSWSFLVFFFFVPDVVSRFPLHRSLMGSALSAWSVTSRASNLNCVCFFFFLLHNGFLKGFRDASRDSLCHDNSFRLAARAGQTAIRRPDPDFRCPKRRSPSSTVRTNCCVVVV